MRINAKITRNLLIFSMLILAVIMLALLNVRVGAAPVSWKEIIQAFTGGGNPDLSHIVIHYQLPRILLALLVGSGLAVAGLISQAILLNPLAAPDTLGISAGAALGAVLTVLLLQPDVQSQWVTSLAAFAGGSLGALLVYLLSYQQGLNPVRLALVGIAISACGSTLMQLLVIHSAPIPTLCCCG